MADRDGMLARFSAFVHHNLLWMLVAGYALAGFAPAAGLWLRGRQLAALTIAGRESRVSLPALMLALLLFNAGLGVDPRRLGGLVRHCGVLLAGLAANVAVPLAFILAVSLTLGLWHNPTEVQSILVGLALVAAMPIAGSSTAWSQNADGDLALSLGLVVGSTVLSPLTTPAVLRGVGWVATGEFADALARLGGDGTSVFLATFVMAPSLAGILARCLVNERVMTALKPGLKLVNSAVLLTLCYANAAVALPRVVAAPDWDFLVVMLVVVTAFCVTGFLAGAALARLFGADAGRRASLMFGLGMMNNGTGLVIAASALANLPDVLLPIIFYNLVQHVVAGLFQRWSAGGEHEPEIKSPSYLQPAHSFQTAASDS